MGLIPDIVLIKKGNKVASRLANAYISCCGLPTIARLYQLDRIFPRLSAQRYRRRHQSSHHLQLQPLMEGVFAGIHLSRAFSIYCEPLKSGMTTPIVGESVSVIAMAWF